MVTTASARADGERAFMAYLARSKFRWGLKGPNVGSGIGFIPTRFNSFSVGNATFKLPSPPSHCGNVQRSVWNVTVFAASSTVYVPKWQLTCPTGIRGLSDAV